MQRVLSFGKSAARIDSHLLLQAFSVQLFARRQPAERASGSPEPHDGHGLSLYPSTQAKGSFLPDKNKNEEERAGTGGNPPLPARQTL